MDIHIAPSLTPDKNNNNNTPQPFWRKMVCLWALQDPMLSLGFLPRASGDGANTSLAGYVCLEAEFQGGEDDFHAATPDAIAYFAATLGWPSCSATLFLGEEDDFDAAMPAAFAFVAAFVGWPSCFVVDSPAAATPVFAALHVLLPLFFLGMVAVALQSLGSAR